MTTWDADVARTLLSEGNVGAEFLRVEREIQDLRELIKISTESLAANNKYRNQLRALKDYGELWQRQPITVRFAEWHKGKKYTIGGFDNNRGAEVYSSAHDGGKTFGVRIQEYWAKGSDHRWFGGKYL